MTITRSTLTVDGGELPMTIARGTGTGAAIVIMPSAFGVGPDLEAQMEELAADARVVVTYDPFFRDDPGLVPYEDMPRIMARIGALDRARTYRDLSALITHVRAEHPGTRVVMLGICFGGPFGLAAAADARIDALVVWHGSWMERFLDRAAEMGCPMSLHFGSVDPVTPPAAIDAVRAAFAGRSDVELVVHDGATHGFSQRRAGVYLERAERAGMAALHAFAARL